MDVIKKHGEDKFLVPCTDIHKQDIFELLDRKKYSIQKLLFTKPLQATSATLPM